jgi:hypothetical protein
MEMSYIGWLIFGRIVINIIVATVTVSIAFIIYKGSNSKLAKPLLIMFASTAMEILLVSISLYLSESHRHELAIIGRLIQFAGKIYFLSILISRNGSLTKDANAL